MKQEIDSIEKLQKKIVWKPETEWDALKNAIPIKYYCIRYTIIESFYTLLCHDVEQNRHSRANITTMHNLFSITSTIRIELNWIQFKHFFATCFCIITCNFAN